MAELIVNKGERYTVDPLFQWDINQTLEIHGLSLASDPEIHFSTEVLNGAIVRQATRDSKGIIMVKIPNSLLQKPYKIDVFVCVYEDARKVGTATGVIKTGGAGQGTTTRAFGESNGTLYAGGGGGSWSPSGHTGAVGQGGAGGGGRGRNNDNSGNIDGTNGTPNTGGGSGGFSGAKVNGQGGSGIVIVRWGY